MYSAFGIWILFFINIFFCYYFSRIAAG